MTAAVSETKPVDQTAVEDAADTDDIDALLAQADALAEEAVETVVEESRTDTDSSDQAESLPVEPAAKAEGSDNADPTAEPTSGIDSTLEDLDSLLDELGENSEEESKADDGATASASGPASDKGDDNPYAGEVAQMEQQWAAEASGSDRSISPSSAPPSQQAQAAETEDGTGEPSTEHLPSFPIRIVYRLAAVAAGVLAVLDFPFAWVNPQIKNIVGYAAVATFVVAVAVWVAGPFLVHG